MNKLVAIVCLSILAAPVMLAAGEKPAPSPIKTKPADQPTAAADTKSKPSEDPIAIVVKNKSSFEVDAAMRNPFWPIGFKPKARIGGAGDAEGQVPSSAFLVSSITFDTGTHFAIINGKIMVEGQQFGLQVGTQIYQVSVKRIEDGRVVLSHHDEEIVVPLRRK
jgi:hypothetical protein